MVSFLQDYVEHVMTPLHACSLESLPEPVETKNGYVWPLLLGCYQLQNETRRGKLELYSVAVPEDDGCPITLGPSKTVYDDSGILDGKWCLQGNIGLQLYATAHAAGDIQIRNLVQNESQEIPYDCSNNGQTDKHE